MEIIIGREVFIKKNLKSFKMLQFIIEKEEEEYSHKSSQCSFFNHDEREHRY